MASATPCDLQDAIAALCRSALGAGVRRCDPVAAGLGARRFFRVALDAPPLTAIARCELPEDPSLRPAGIAPEPPLEPIRSLLERAGLPVPRRVAADEVHGIELLEDLGDQTLECAARDASRSERRVLYAQACALVPRLQALRAPPEQVPNFGRHLDATLFRYKAEQVITWLVPCATGRAATPAEQEVVMAAFAEIEAAAVAAPQRLAHRDFKAQNLHVVERDGDRELVMIDLQGAFLAPPEYDLVCLLRDLQVELDPAEIRDQLAAVRSALPDAPSAEELRRRFELLTLSRVGKDLARFLFAVHERGDERYRAHLPTGVRHLRAAMRATAPWSAALARFADLLGALPEAPCAR
jgi:aminoglycoside/choline kinase family phosphotransferase